MMLPQFLGLPMRDSTSSQLNFYLSFGLSLLSSSVLNSNPQASEHSQHCLINDDNNQISVWHPTC